MGKISFGSTIIYDSETTIVELSGFPEAVAAAQILASPNNSQTKILQAIVPNVGVSVQTNPL